MLRAIRSIDHLIVTVDRPLDVSSPSIGTGAGFTAVGYPIASGNLDLTHQILTYTILESGLPDTGVNPFVHRVRLRLRRAGASLPWTGHATRAILLYASIR